MDSNMHMEDKGDIYSNLKKRSFQMEAERDATFRINLEWKDHEE